MASMRDDGPYPGVSGLACGPDDDVHPIAAAVDSLPGLEQLEQRLGPGHPKVAVCLESIAGLCRDQGRLDEAERLYRRALAILEKAVAPEDPRIADILENLTILLYERGREDEARGLFDRAKTVREAHKPRGDAPARDDG